jgi:CRISPR-associated protein Csx17
VYGNYGDSFISLRRQLEPVKCGMKNGALWVGWDELATVDVAWHEGDVIDALNAVMTRRILLAQQAGSHAWPDTGRRFASPSHVAALIEGRIDLDWFAGLLWGLALLDWPQIPAAPWPHSDSEPKTFPGAVFAILKLCFAGVPVRGVEVPLVPDIQQRARAGRGADATQLASRRLRASGLGTSVDQVHQQGPAIMRAAAALLLPSSQLQISALAQAVLRSQTKTTLVEAYL